MNDTITFNKYMFYYACKYNQLATVQKMIDDGLIYDDMSVIIIRCDYDESIDDYGDPLWHAILYEKLPLVKILLSVKQLSDSHDLSNMMLHTGVLEILQLLYDHCHAVRNDFWVRTFNMSDTHKLFLLENCDSEHFKVYSDKFPTHFVDILKCLIINNREDLVDKTVGKFPPTCSKTLYKCKTLYYLYPPYNMNEEVTTKCLKILRDAGYECLV